MICSQCIVVKWHSVCFLEMEQHLPYLIWFWIYSLLKQGSSFCHTLYIKVKQSHDRPGLALRVPGVWGSQISKQSAHEGGKFVSPTHRPPLLQEIFLVIISFRFWVDPRALVEPVGLCQWKIPMTPIGNGTRDFPACSAVPQPTAPPRAPYFFTPHTNV